MVKPPILRLALTSSIGFSPAVAIPFWVSDVGKLLELPIWWGAAVATLQLACAAVLNALTPWLFSKMQPRQLGPIAALVSFGGCAAALIPNAYTFLVGCAVGGAGFGVLLNSTNRLIATCGTVQRAYAVFQVTETVFGVTFFMLAPLLLRQFGVPAVFSTLAVMALLAFVLLTTLPTPSRESDVTSGSAADNRHIGAAALVLFALMMYCMGYNVVGSFLVVIGRTIGLEATQIGRIMSLGLGAGLVGAVTARLLGERLGIVVPVVVSAAILIVDLLILATTSSSDVFTIAVVIMFVCSVFVVPYFMTKLAFIGDAGRWASIGPAFVLAGIALAPSIAAYVSTTRNLAALGGVASSLICASAVMYLIGSGLVRSRS
jgi:hypothetical protein